MSYERPDSTNRLEQYRARQIARMEAMNRAIDEGRTKVVSSDDRPPVDAVQRRVFVEGVREGRLQKFARIKPRVQERVIRRLERGEWVGSNKSVTAIKVEVVMRPPMNVTHAAPIAYAGSIPLPKDGQLFAYEASTGRMVEVEIQRNVDSRQRTRRSQQRQHQAPYRNAIARSK